MRRVLVIAGPPCSGKTTLALQLAQPGDLVLDRDVLARQLGSRRGHMHSRYITRLAEQRMRTRLARLASTVDDVTAYVVRCAPLAAQRERLAQQLGAEVQLLDPGIEECLRRARAAHRPAGTVRAIHQWYARCDADGRPARTAGLVTSQDW